MMVSVYSMYMLHMIHIRRDSTVIHDLSDISQSGCKIQSMSLWYPVHKGCHRQRPCEHRSRGGSDNIFERVWDLNGDTGILSSRRVGANKPQDIGYACAKIVGQVCDSGQCSFF